jgi:hypothetical protein
MYSHRYVWSCALLEISQHANGRSVMPVMLSLRTILISTQ